jgi:excisionase family DNA binding protein
MENSAESNPFLTVQEVAQYLQFSEATIRSWAKTKKIPAVKVGRCWRFQKRVIDDWLKWKSIRAAA